jgi:hypothetical protein
MFIGDANIGADTEAARQARRVDEAALNAVAQPTTELQRMSK